MGESPWTRRTLPIVRCGERREALLAGGVEELDADRLRPQIELRGGDLHLCTARESDG